MVKTASELSIMVYKDLSVPKQRTRTTSAYLRNVRLGPYTIHANAICTQHHTLPLLARYRLSAWDDYTEVSRWLMK